MEEKKTNLEQILSKFISVSETHFQNTETAFKIHQASIQGLETQIGQLSKLISERPQGSLPSNTEPNPREQLNTINIQDDEGVVEPEPESRQETVVSKGQGEVGDKTITLQARNSGNTSGIEGLVHEDRRLQIEERDEWRTHKPRTPDKSKLRQNEPDTSPNKLKVGTMSSLRGKKTTVPASKKRKEASSSVGPTAKIRHPLLSSPKGPKKSFSKYVRPNP
ncbi:hypothetical protein GOBAR_AA35591 [Gossypium barbadense]|uniref:Uncharacterized protein n=1 Tax=Gossypium barbadense TaxID=3634 RepID=A0A2P5W1Y1_GOSBA|nr:hypothetical protein GOBAR_AA35591 [Gossypium barbadense]